MKRISDRALRLLHASTLAVFFLFGWWLRPDYPDWLPRLPYFAGFLIAIPMIAAVGLWLMLGLPGLNGVLRDARLWWLLGLTMLTAWIIVSPNWSDYRTVAEGSAAQFVAAALFALVALCAGPTPRAVAAALAAGIIVQAVVIVAQVGLQRPVGLAALGEFEIRPNQRGLSVVAAGPERLMRPYGLTIHPNVVGGGLAVGLLAMTGWLARAEQGAASWRWLVRLGAALLGLWALCLTFSRSAWGALLVGLVLVGLASLPRLRPGAAQLSARRSVVVGLASIVVIGLFILGYAQFIRARAATADEQTEQISIAERQLFIEIALQIFHEHPVAGVGIGAYAWEARDILAQGPYRYVLRAQNVHNVPLLVLTELGLIGAALWAATLLTGAILLWRGARDPFAVGLGAGCAALLAIGLLDHYPWTVLHFVLLLWAGMAIAIRGESPAR